MNVLGERKKGLLFVVSAPAGTGKTTLVRMLLEEFDCVVQSISFTTRHPRPMEVSGKDYHFISITEFEKKMEDGEFLEYAKVFGQYYGTSRKLLSDLQSQGKHVILVIDTQGALFIKKSLDAIFIFIHPPSIDVLRERLSRRKSETSEAIESRLSWAKKEMTLASEYDYEIVNDRLDTAYDVLRSILIAEEHRINH
jgi:guanylate kinase